MAKASVRGAKRVPIAEVAKEHGYEKLTEEQLLTIDEFVSGKDVFVSLPTGFGKSLIWTHFLPFAQYRMAGSGSGLRQTRGPPTPSDQRNVASYRQD